MHKRRRTSSAASRQDDEMNEDDSLEQSPVATGSIRKRKKMDPVGAETKKTPNFITNQNFKLIN